MDRIESSDMVRPVRASSRAPRRARSDEGNRVLGRHAAATLVPGDFPEETALSDEAEMHLRAERRRARIAEAAYYRAERRGFAPGCEEQDWYEAEAEIDRYGEEDRAGAPPA